MLNIGGYYRYYRKAVHAAAGLALWLTLRHFGIEIPGLPSLVFDLIAGALVVAAVERSPNGDKPVRPKK